MPALEVVREALAGREERAFVVGGTLRDALLAASGRAAGPDDVDIAVEGDPEPAARAVARRGRAAVFALSEAFGAWRVVDRAGGWTCDVSPLQGGTIESDLAHRDFSVNAMALPLPGAGPDDELIDPHGGRADLDAGVLRVLGGDSGASSAYVADPLRVLRLARLATELPLRPERRTEGLARAAAPLLGRVSPERIFGELRRVVVAERVLDGVELLDRLGALAVVAPELDALHGVDQSHFHHLDAYGHTLEVLRRSVELERDPGAVFGAAAPGVRAVLAEALADELTRGQALRLAALLHDVAKPRTREVRPDGRVTFLHHHEVGEEMVSGMCRRLRTSEALRTFLAGTTRHHLVLGFLVHERPLGRRAVFRYLRECSPVEVEVTVLSCADRLATRGRNAERAIAAHLELAREVMPDALAWRRLGPPRPPLRGDELARELDLRPGPELGALLAELAEARFAGEISTREQAVAHARAALLATREGSL